MQKLTGRHFSFGILSMLLIFTFGFPLDGQAFGKKAPPHYQPNFVWGAALSGHQAEGGYGGGENGDWYQYEHSNNAQGQPNIFGGVTSDVASDFWHRYAEDFDLAKEMGLTSIRTSVSWEKIEPARGVFSTEVLQHYRLIFSSMKEHGIRPVIIFHHFVNPNWFDERGGWVSPDAPADFLLYARTVVEQLGDLCDLWMTFNEPLNYVTAGYLEKAMPPFQSGLDTAYEAAFQMARAHRMVAAMIHEKQGPSPGGKGPNGELRGVSLASAAAVYDPYDPSNKMDKKAAQVLSALANWAFVHSLLSDRMKWDIPKEVPNSHSFEREYPKDDLPVTATEPSLDWLGVNYYVRWLMQYDPQNSMLADWHTPPGPANDNGWNIYPEGLERILREAADQFPGMPLVVTENGLSDANDTMRPQFIRDHLAAVDRAVNGSKLGPPLDVRGYYHWSLTDNFEWSQGFRYRFGLIAVDFQNGQKRMPRGSASVYHDEIVKRTRVTQ